jgi:hypothetical protein
VFSGDFFNAQLLAMYHNLQNYNGSMFPQDLELPLASPSPTLLSLMESTPACETSTSSLTPWPNDHLRLLAVAEDSSALNPLHCFVRRNVEVFIATKDDVAAPSPGRRTRVKIGRVGIRCIHCVRLPTKDRVKCAICYPPSISGIYHSVSNMKFDHFVNWKGLSPEAQLEFASLRNLSNHRNRCESLIMVLLVFVAEACYGMRVQSKTVMSSPKTVTAKLAPMTDRKKKRVMRLIQKSS